MGKGDIKTRKGKITNGSFGVRRNRKDDKPAMVNNEKATVETISKVSLSSKPKKTTVPEPAVLA